MLCLALNLNWKSGMILLLLAIVVIPFSNNFLKSMSKTGKKLIWQYEVGLSGVTDL